MDLVPVQFYKRYNIILLILAGIVILSSCKTLGKSNTQIPERLEDKKWILEEMFIDHKTVKPSKDVFIVFNSADSSWHGKIYCNTVNGHYSKRKKCLCIGVKAITYMACDEIKFEADFVEIIKTTNTYQIEGGKLILRNKDNKTAVFR